MRTRLICFLLLCVSNALAAGPRWVAGPQWTNNTQIMNWYRPDVQYFVDAGALSASVNNAAAVALVNAAAAVWTVQGIPFSLSNGGTLSEDVGADNVYLGSNGIVWPADVQSANYTAKQIAVVLDADGSVTDTLLGSGASAPGNCRTNAVTESVDLFVQPGKIAHAIIVVNGRCSGPAAEQQQQLRYQLMRVFGRVIGLGWSQLNDNVFTGTPAPTYQQQLHWPIMHPIDIVCGPYTYQCLPQPFTLRPDDVASLAMVYAGQLNQSNAGKVSVDGWLRFPNGQGMTGVNLVAQRNYPNDNYGTEAYGMVSTVSGFLAPGDLGNAVTGPPADTAGKQGGSYGFAPGYFLFYGVPSLTQFSYTSLLIHSEPINPLYVRTYSVGPYRMGNVQPAGDAVQFQSFGNAAGAVAGTGSTTPANAPYQCAATAAGTEDAPAALPSEGVWSGRFCGAAGSAWAGFPVRAGHTATIEVTALDESGLASTAKAMPVIGLWHGGDPTGTAPTLASVVAFNSIRVGMTQLRASFAADEPVRMAFADQRGEARPDFLYRARVLYADTVTPSRMTPSGGPIHIAGTGFQQGMTVTVGGVMATLTNITATGIDAVAPALTALAGTAANDVTVTDPRTTGSSTIVGGLTYSGAANDTLALVTAPPATVYVGASATFAVRLTDSTGAPAPNGTVAVSANGGQVVFSACGLPTCTLVTDATGLAQTQVTPQAAGNVTLTATAKNGSTVQASFLAVQVARSVTFRRPMQYVAAGSGATFHPAVQLTGSDAAAAAQSVSWTTASPRVVLGTSRSQGSGSQVDATSSLYDGEAASVQACAWTGVCATGNLLAVAATDLRVTVVAGDSQTAPAAATLQAVTFRVTDTAGHPVAGATAGIYQAVVGWQPPCPAAGRCPVAPVYGKSNTAAVSDDDGLLTIDPLQYSGTAAVTRLTVTVGTAGVATVTLQKTP